MTQALPAPVHLFDYLTFEDTSPQRHETVGGRIHAMTGATLRHHRMALNAASALMQKLGGAPCNVYINDMKLHVQAADSVYDPDVFVDGGAGPAGSQKVVFDALQAIEVMSGNTAGSYRREKLTACQRLPGPQAYWIVHQDECRVDVHARDALSGWSATAYGPGETLPVAVPGFEPVALDALYAGTDLSSSG